MNTAGRGTVQAQLPRSHAMLPACLGLSHTFSISIKSCQFSGLPSCSAETMSKGVLWQWGLCEMP